MFRQLTFSHPQFLPVPFHDFSDNLIHRQPAPDASQEEIEIFYCIETPYDPTAFSIELARFNLSDHFPLLVRNLTEGFHPCIKDHHEDPSWRTFCDCRSFLKKIWTVVRNRAPFKSKYFIHALKSRVETNECEAEVFGEDTQDGDMTEMNAARQGTMFKSKYEHEINQSLDKLKEVIIGHGG
ncbi:hypothetical protein DFJ43DRAFT_577512 [Lentinula guzmanii]|uniref:Uncharacterized protein n=1 Tax=Lentinula guzmanii TaxID=2804957 RepID=A0AA38JBT3_9AGAR|nr:hypothetical protein DFJ43DRAFT_577512 [Lentinula guzmanii]